MFTTAFSNVPTDGSKNSLGVLKDSMSDCIHLSFPSSHDQLIVFYSLYMLIVYADIVDMDGYTEVYSVAIRVILQAISPLVSQIYHSVPIVRNCLQTTNCLMYKKAIS